MREFLERQHKALLQSPAVSDRQHFEKAIELKNIQRLIRKVRS